MYEVEFQKYSILDYEEKNSLIYLKIKRLVLRIFRTQKFEIEFDMFHRDSILRFALEYFDIDSPVIKIAYNKKYAGNGLYNRKSRDKKKVLIDIFYSIYENSPAKFQTFLSFILKEFKSNFNFRNIEYFWEELKILGFEWDGAILKTTSGDPVIEQHITSMIEDKLIQINPELVQMRKGAIESLLSNSEDKDRHVSSSCRALINTLMQNLVPEEELKNNGQGKIKQRMNIFLDSKNEANLIEKSVEFIQALNSSQAKGDHEVVDEDLAYLIFELTDKLVYFLLTRKK